MALIIPHKSGRGSIIPNKYHYDSSQLRKQSIWEESTRVPLIIVAPGITKAGTKTDKVVSLMDLYPTLHDIMGWDIPNHLEGRTLRPLIEDQMTNYVFRF